MSQTQGQTSSADTERTVAKGSLCKGGTKEGEVGNTVSQTQGQTSSADTETEEYLKAASVK